MITIELRTTIKGFLLLIFIQGRVRRAYATISHERAYGKLAEWKWLCSNKHLQN